MSKRPAFPVQIRGGLPVAKMAPVKRGLFARLFGPRQHTIPLAQFAPTPGAQKEPPQQPRLLPTALPVAKRIPPLPSSTIAQEDENAAPFANRYTALDLGAPVNKWSRIRSTWVYAVRYDPYPDGPLGDLQIETTDGWIGLWDNTTRQDYLQLWHAPRKGVWLKNWGRKSDYTTVREQQYFGAVLRQRVQANA
jgi:hypothetical protein